LLKADKQQYTCVNDINENEIYDGDHCEFGDSLMRVAGNGFVHFERGTFYLDGSILSHHTAIKKIGNKYGKKELTNEDK